LPFWLLIALWGTFLLATIFSLDPYYSFWESPYRAGGFLNFSLYIIFAVLTFLIIKGKDWLKLWKFSLIIGVLVSLVAVMQYFKVFSQHLIPYEGRPPSTFGNTIFLGIYLLFSVFMGLNLFLKEKQKVKKILYLLALLLFLFVILITGSRAVYFGLLIGFTYFILFFPKKQRLVVLLKILFILLLIVGVYGVYYLNTAPKLPDYLQKNKTAQQVFSRLSVDLLSDPRFSAWQIALEAIKEKPILGWGPENFSIAFDKHYDPSLPQISKEWGGWFDKAHNFAVETATTTGIPSLLIYLSFFGALFWQLQKIKKLMPKKSLTCHNIQAGFIAYLTANLFSFDTFSTYLILFFFIAYSFYLINGSRGPNQEEKQITTTSPPLWKSGLVFGLFCILAIFIWSHCLKPFEINKDINWAVHYSTNGQCLKAIETMDNEVIPNNTIINSYARLQYIDIIRNCLQENSQNKYVLAPKAVETLREETKIRPYYTRAWITLGAYLNVLVQNKETLKIENSNELLKEADLAFEKAAELNPKREDTFIGWIETKLMLKDYEQAREKADICVSLNLKNKECWWYRGLTNIYLGNLEQADQDIALAKEKEQNINSNKSLIQLQNAYMKTIETIEDSSKKTEYYKRLADVYQRSIKYIDDKNFQYYASLAYVYKELGEYKKARESALIVLELSPESKENVKAFLKSLPTD